MTKNAIYFRKKSSFECLLIFRGERLSTCNKSFAAFTEVTSYVHITLTIITLPLAITTKKQFSSDAPRTQKLSSDVSLV